MTAELLAELVAPGGVFLLSGAGMSTASGIPAYRGVGARRQRAAPMTTQVFDADPVARRRYWARSHLGWQTIGLAEPNPGHRAVADLQRAGLLHAVVTQNVDGLHQAGGATGVVELHGNLGWVRCRGCGARSGRDELHARLEDANAGWSGTALALHPDGDVELDDEAVGAFRVLSCLRCGGVLKPDVVFFGGTVERGTVLATYAALERSRALLVLGSSLTVMSGYRFVLRAAKLGMPVALVGLGVTRGDHLASLTVGLPLQTVLPAVVARLHSGPTRPDTSVHPVRGATGAATLLA